MRDGLGVADSVATSRLQQKDRVGRLQTDSDNGRISRHEVGVKPRIERSEGVDCSQKTTRIKGFRYRTNGRWKTIHEDQR